MGKSKNKRRMYRNEDIVSINRTKCIGCSACGIACRDVTGVSVLRLSKNGRKIAETKKDTFKSTGCVYCGQCTFICPTSAVSPRNDIKKVNEALKSGKKYMVATVAPAIKATLGEEFDLLVGTSVEGKLQAAIKRLGFNKVFDTNFGADMTVIEESTELIERLGKKENLPMFTSCCPSWVRWAELFRPDILKHLSTCKSPQQIMGKCIKTYFAENLGIPPQDIFVVSIKPCVSKKYEAEKEEVGSGDYRDIDVVLTVREFAELLKQNNIDIKNIKEEESDSLLGKYSGSGAIFGASGGVMEATLRAVAYYLKDNPSIIDNLNFIKVYGTDGIREGEVIIGGQKLKVAIIGTLSELDSFLSGDKWREYSFIEVMACPSGCINGGGTPKVRRKSEIKEKNCVSCGTCIENCPVNAIRYNDNGYAESNKEICIGCTLCSKICRTKAITIKIYDKATNEPLKLSYVSLRVKVLRDIYKNSIIKISPENSEVKLIYKNYLGEPNGTKAKALLHTTYKDASKELQRCHICSKK